MEDSHMNPESPETATSTPNLSPDQIRDLLYGAKQQIPEANDHIVNPAEIIAKEQLSFLKDVKMDIFLK
jgi:hypothetical protein